MRASRSASPPISTEVPSSGLQDVGNRRTDAFAYLRVEHRVAVLVEGDEAQFDQHRRSLELQDREIGPQLDLAILELEDLEQGGLHLLRQFLIRRFAKQHLEAVGVIAVGIVDMDGDITVAA